MKRNTITLAAMLTSYSCLSIINMRPKHTFCQNKFDDKERNVKKLIKDDLDLLRKRYQQGTALPVKFWPVQNGFVLSFKMTMSSEVLSVLSQFAGAEILLSNGNVTLTEREIEVVLHDSNNGTDLEWFCSSTKNNVSPCIEKFLKLFENIISKDSSNDPQSSSVPFENKLNLISTKLENLGVKVVLPAKDTIEITDSDIVGYESQKKLIKSLLDSKIDDTYSHEQLKEKTRQNPEKESSNIHTILFEGPPGCGKTSMARLMSNFTQVPFVYVPCQVILSKFYEQSESRFADILDLSNELGENSIIFFDEIDSLAPSRDSDIHEVTRRLLSMLLQHIDGFRSSGLKKQIVILSTNRKHDLDLALLSRCKNIIKFDLPDAETRKKIFKFYAKHLTDTDIELLAKETVGFSGRDIQDLCDICERTHIYDQKNDTSLKLQLPSLQQYLKHVENKRIRE